MASREASPQLGQMSNKTDQKQDTQADQNSPVESIEKPAIQTSDGVKTNAKPLQDTHNCAPTEAMTNAPIPKQSTNAPTASLSSSVSQSQSLQRLTIDQQLSKAKRDLESMVIKYAKSESDNLQNKSKIEELERKLKRAIKDNDSLANRVKILTTDKNHLSETLSAKVAQLTVLEQKNCSISSDQRNRLKELENKVVEVEARNEELLKQIDIYKSKEADLLDFSERLSMKQLLLQTELDKALENAPDYKVDYERLAASHGELKEELAELTQQLAQANESLDLERARATSLAESHDQVRLSSRRQIEELENEIKLVRRKCQVATKELLKRVRQYEPEYSG